MSDRAALLEATLESLPEGVGLLGEDCRVVFWNQAAQAITGYATVDVVGRPAPAVLRDLLDGSGTHQGQHGEFVVADHGRGFMTCARHKLGHDVSTMTRHMVLRDGLGQRIGTAVLFHPTESLDALPHGETGASEGVAASQEELKERLETLFDDLASGGEALGVLWINVDQAHDLRRTHGAGACEAMVKKVERALTQGLRPAEYLGRWGEDEFLVISHERTAAMLDVHARALAALVVKADFRWWGDRVALTVSVGAAQTWSGGSLAQLLERAKDAMFASQHAGGNQITRAAEGSECSRS
jgi:diguanylate cyclase (GGDEF)-like protein/PAS domain S-box-containing protein